MSNRIYHKETDKDIYFQTDRVKSKTNGDTFEASTLLQQDGANNDISKKFGSGYRFTKDRTGDDSDVKRKKTNQDFSQDKKEVKKRKKVASRLKVSTTKVKARNF